jgi:hypothetical protein
MMSFQSGAYRSRSVAFALATAIAMCSLAPGAADAAVCAAGVYRAGCVGPHGGVVVNRPPHYHGCYWRAGVRVCR